MKKTKKKANTKDKSKPKEPKEKSGSQLEEFKKWLDSKGLL